MSVKNKSSLIVILLPLILVLHSCGSLDNKEMENQKVKISDLKMNSIVHEDLPTELVERIKTFHSKLSDVNSTDLETTLTNFKRDQNPESEVEVWETITSAYESSLKDLKGATIRTKNEVYNLLLMRSMMPSEAVLKQIQLKVLSKDEALLVLGHYGVEPEKIKISNE